MLELVLDEASVASVLVTWEGGLVFPVGAQGFSMVL